VSEADVEKYYKDHASEYVRPELVRASEILVKDRAKALKVLAQAKALPPVDMKAFRDLVAQYSEDADSKQRSGDLTQFDRKTTQHPPAVVAATFALKEIGDLSDLVPTDKGFALLKLTERKPALSRELAEVKLDIQKRLLDELRSKKRNEFVEAARKDINVEIYEDQLAKLEFAPSGAPEEHAPAPGVVAGPGGASPSAARGAAHDAGAMVEKQP